MSWSQKTPQVQSDDINKDPKYSQYPYQEVDEYEDEEEDMEIDDRALGKTGGARMATPTSTQHLYYRPEATYSRPRPDQARVHPAVSIPTLT